MLTIPSVLHTQFREYLRDKTVPPNTQAAYTKWLRYYLDFCQKYHCPHEDRASLPHFLQKLQDKKQTQAQQEQAAHAIAVYYELADSNPIAPSPTSVRQPFDSAQEESSTKPSPDPGEIASQSLAMTGSGSQNVPVLSDPGEIASLRSQ